MLSAEITAFSGHTQTVSLMLLCFNFEVGVVLKLSTHVCVWRVTGLIPQTLFKNLTANICTRVRQLTAQLMFL